MNTVCDATSLPARCRRFLEEAAPERLPALESLEAAAARQSFRICVAGGFSRGKSHFVNALLGTDLLTERAIPSTGSLTEIVYGETPGLEYRGTKLPCPRRRSRNTPLARAGILPEKFFGFTIPLRSSKETWS